MDHTTFAQDQAVTDEKAEVAKKMAKNHYRAEAGLQRIFRLNGSAEVEVRPVEPDQVAGGQCQHRSIWYTARANRPGPCQRDSLPFRHRGSFAGGIRQDSDEGVEIAEGVATRRRDAPICGRHRWGVMATPAQWARAYARQADADFQSWQAMESDEAVHPCHRMLFLQMACEKLCKAGLIDDGTAPEALQTSHGFVAQPLPIIIRGQLEFMGQNLGARRPAFWPLPTAHRCRDRGDGFRR